MAPGFRRDDVWTPAFAGVTTFYERIKIPSFCFELQVMVIELVFRISDFVLRIYLLYNVFNVIPTARIIPIAQY